MDFPKLTPEMESNAILKDITDLTLGEDVRLSKEERRSKTTKRLDYISWDDYFMAVSFLSAMRSKDPNTQVGACIVNDDNKIVGVGYNGMPRGCNDHDMPWARESPDPLQIKYLYVCHAELNAVLNKNSADVKSCRIFVALFPCNECAKVIIQAGIRAVIYMSDKKKGTLENTASKRMFDMAGVQYWQHIPKQRKIVIDMDNVC